MGHGGAVFGRPMRDPRKRTSTRRSRAGGHGRRESATRDSIVNLLGAIIGIALEARTQQKYHVQGLGLNLSDLGTRAVTTSFSRDQEREADALGVGWMVDAGYDPDGAIRLWTKMLRSQGDSPLVFLNTHPNPSERLDNVRWLAQENSGRVTQVANSAKQPTPTPPVQSTPQPAASLVAATSENTANSAFRRGLAAA